MNPTSLFATVERRVMDTHRAIYTKSNGRLLDPGVEVTIDGTSRPMVARTLSGGERSVLWPRLVRRFPLYAIYQFGNKREIPVVVLELAD